MDTLKKSKEKYRLMYEASPDAIMLLDEHGFLDCNPATLKIFGCATIEEFIGHHPSEYSPSTQPDGKASQEAADEKIAAAYKTGSNRFEWTHQRANGEIFPAEVQLTLLTLKEGNVLQASVRDITKRKQTEERLQSLSRLSARTTGDDFFRVLVSSITNALHVKVAFVAAVNSPEADSACSLALSIDNEHSENIQWALSGTPCEKVAKGEYMFVADGVQEKFPDDQWLLEIGAESYAGIPIKDNQGDVIGHIGILDDKPLHKKQEIRSLLNIFSDRAAAELERKQAHEELLSNEANFRYLVEANCYAIVVHKDFQIVYANASAQEIFEASDVKSAMGQSIFDYIHPRYQNFAKKGIQRVIRKNRTISPIQIKGITAKEREIDIDLRSIPIAFNQSDAVMSVIYDITAQKRSEYFTRQTSEIFKMVASAVPADKIYNAICHMYEEMYPRMRTSILKLKGNQLFHCSAPSLPDEYSQAINGGEIGPCAGSCGTAAFLGKEVIVEDIATDPLWEAYKALALPHDLRACWSEPIMGNNGNILGTLAMYFNQPSKPSENELKEIRNASALVAIIMEKESRKALLGKLSQAVKQAGESTVITDVNGVIEYTNPAFTKLTGYTAEEAIGQTPRLLNSDNQGNAFYEAMWKTITDGNIWYGKVIDKRKDGSFFPCMLSISPISNNEGVITHFVGTHADLSKLEEMENSFHQAQKMEALGTLVGGIAHDFNNMLAGMTGNLYLAKQKTKNMPDVLLKLANIERLSFRAADMIQQLLTFARKGLVDMKQLPLNPFIKETLKFLRTTVPENIALHHDICKDTLLVNGDATQMHQVLMNLVNNACDAVEEADEPCITVRLDRFQPDDAFMASHSYFKPLSYARLCVSDNGCGIPEHQIEHLFEPFFTTKEQGKGTGLGLAMVFGAIKTHHGYVEVESSEGNGSTFHVYLPLLKIEDIASAPLQNEEIIEGNGETILIVDDDAIIRSVSREVLENLNYRVLEAVDGLEAIETFTEHQDEITLIIMDVVMPKLGGIKAAERIRETDPDVKVIFATGYDKESTFPGEIPLKGAAIIHKPYDIETFSKIIRSQLKA